MGKEEGEELQWGRIGEGEKRGRANAKEEGGRRERANAKVAGGRRRRQRTPQWFLLIKAVHLPQGA